jgi:hypothetical protein
MNQQLRDDIARLKFEASQHRAAARHLDARARQTADPLDKLRYQSFARERRSLAKQADEQRRGLWNSDRVARIMNRYDGREV